MNSSRYMNPSTVHPYKSIDSSREFTHQQSDRITLYKTTDSSPHFSSQQSVTSRKSAIWQVSNLSQVASQQFGQVSNLVKSAICHKSQVSNLVRLGNSILIQDVVSNLDFSTSVSHLFGSFFEIDFRPKALSGWSILYYTRSERSARLVRRRNLVG
jgi:hypothetical protein